MGDSWNNGEGMRTGGCRGKVGVQTNTMPVLDDGELKRHILAGNMVKADETWVWDGKGPVRFLRSGTITSPWGEGTWGTVPSLWRKDSLHVKMGGRTYLLMYLSEKWSFV